MISLYSQKLKAVQVIYRVFLETFLFIRDKFNTQLNLSVLIFSFLKINFLSSMFLMRQVYCFISSRLLQIVVHFREIRDAFPSFLKRRNTLEQFK